MHGTKKVKNHWTSDRSQSHDLQPETGRETIDLVSCALLYIRPGYYIQYIFNFLVKMLSFENSL